MSLDLEGARCPEEAARLLPWYVTGRLSTADAVRVSSHLEHCAICRDDLGHERALRELLKSDSRVDYAPQAGLATTLARIDELGRDLSTDAASGPPPRARRGIGALRWLTAAVVLQAIGLGWLGVSLRHGGGRVDLAAPYRTLASDRPSASPAAGPHLRVVFAPGVTLAELQGLLARQRLTIVGGPSDAGAYTLAPGDPSVTAAQLAAKAVVLRADAQVLFAEPAVNDEARTP